MHHYLRLIYQWVIPISISSVVVIILNRQIIIKIPWNIPFVILLVGNVLWRHVFQRVENKDTRHVLKTCLQCLQYMSSNWRNTSMIWAAYISSSNFFEDMSYPCLLTIERSHLFLDAQLQLRPIQQGEHAVCELWIACVCRHIKNGWGREMAGLLWFVRTTTDVVQTTTPNWLKTRDIWWLVSAELACRSDMTKACLSWRHVANMSPILPTKVIPFVTHYGLPEQSIKPPIWVYSWPFPPYICCSWVIKILPNRSIQYTKLFLSALSPSHHPSCLPYPQNS